MNARSEKRNAVAGNHGAADAGPIECADEEVSTESIQHDSRVSLAGDHR
jgi:hypothetical protein